jgi:uncharacterized protein YgiM (DUF1202 family)
MKHFISGLAIIVFSLVLSGCTSFFDKNNKSGLQVLTNDTGAAIFIDGQYLDKAPYINKELKPGQYLLKIQPDDSSLVPYETTINLRKGLLTVLTWKPGSSSELSGGVMYELEKLSSTKQTELSVISIPDGAVISIDGGEKEFSPVLKSDIQPGTHEITISLPSFEEQSHTVNIVQGHRLNILVTLAKNPVAVENETTVDATPAVTTSPSAQINNATNSAKTASASAVTTPPKNDLGNISLNTNAITGPKVTITSTNFFQNNQEVLRVRDAIGVSGKELGFAPVGSSYAYLNETTTGWYKIEFNGQEGWVSSKYAKLEN